MPTYLQLQQEPVWGAEVEAPAHAAFNARLRAHYGHSRSQTGSKGDNNHLRGRHRSRNWVLRSQFCTDRRYGATDARDLAGSGDWLRATDVGISGAEHRAASRRLDAAVRAGRLPCVAEWFGSFDGRTVVGWYQGGPGTSDTSHLYHLHVGIWTRHCDDAAQLALLGDIITGEDDMTPEQAASLDRIGWRVATLLYDAPATMGGDQKGERNQLHERLTALTVKVDAALAAVAAIGSASPEVAAILAELKAAEARLEAEVRDAVADLGEGGAAQVRADK